LHWTAWIKYVIPKEDENDSRFQEELIELSVIGLHMISAICLAGSLFWIFIWFVWLSDFISVAGLLSIFFILFLGISILLLSFWPRVRNQVRFYGIFALFLMAIGDWWGSMQVNIASPERWAFLTGTIALVMLVGIAVIPAKPLQMLALGFLLTISFLGIQLAEGMMGEHRVTASIAIVFMVMIVFVSVVVTAAVYHQRASSYRARRMAEESFEQLREAQVRVMVSENVASQTRFAAALSHELGSPLGSLASAFDTAVRIHEREQEYPDRKDRLEKMFGEVAESGRQSTIRLRKILERMKNLTNLDRAEERVIDLNELWMDTIALNSAEREHNIEISLDLKPLPPLKCCPQQISTVFSNLLRNAVTAIDQKGTIRISSDKHNGEIAMEIQDNGRGIPANKLLVIFDPAFQVKEGRVSTTNWGLLVSRSIITEHGGKIEIDSEEGEGTTVRIVLPVIDKV